MKRQAGAARIRTFNNAVFVRKDYHYRANAPVREGKQQVKKMKRDARIRTSNYPVCVQKDYHYRCNAPLREGNNRWRRLKVADSPSVQ